MAKVYFDAHGHNAPAYSCNKPNDQSGWYYSAGEIDAAILVLEEAEDLASAGMDDTALDYMRVALSSFKQAAK